MVAAPSFAEQAQRVAPAPAGPKILKVIRTTKDGKRSQVMIENPAGGRPTWAWIDNVPGQPLGANSGVQSGKVVVDNTPAQKTPQIASQPQKPKEQPLKVKRGVMSASEAEEIREDLEGALIEGFDLMDKLIINTTKGHPQGLAVWSDMDDADIARLANWRLRRAQVSEKSAVATRTLVAMREQVQIGLILVPRFWKTWQAYMDWGFEMPGAQLRMRQKIARNA